MGAGERGERKSGPDLWSDGAPAAIADGTLCQACGACCAYSFEWPRFTTETEPELARIPRALIDDSDARMRCDGDRCSALVGAVGAATSCSIYPVRPEVCRSCLPGDEACHLARRKFGLS